MNKKLILSALILTMLLVAVFLNKQYFSKNNIDLETDKNNIQEVSKNYKDASYEVEGRVITLKNGSYEEEAAPGSASKISTNYFGNDAVGDLNGDGTQDIAFFLTQDGDGTGTFFYVVVALKIGDGYKGTNAVFLGDRIAPQTMEIRNGALIANYAERRADEPMTSQPSMGKSKYLAISAGKLVEAPVFVESPQKDSVINSPLTVTGVAKGTWFFEATFPLVLLDGGGNIIAQSFATAEGEWMTTDYVRFSGTLKFTKPVQGGSGKLILKKDNPSDLPEHDDSREVPVIF